MACLHAGLQSSLNPARTLSPFVVIAAGATGILLQDSQGPLTLVAVVTPAAATAACKHCCAWHKYDLCEKYKCYTRCRHVLHVGVCYVRSSEVHRHVRADSYLLMEVV